MQSIRVFSSLRFLLVGLVCVLGHGVVLYYSKLESAYLGRAS